MEELWRNAFNKGFRGFWSFPDPLTALEGLNHEIAGARIDHIPHTIWQISKHSEDWAWAVLKELQRERFPGWTAENNYYPVEDAPGVEDWEAHLQSVQELPDELTRVLESFDQDLTVRDWDNIPAPQTLMILITHTAYHTAQIIMLRRLLGVWETKAK